MTKDKTVTMSRELAETGHGQLIAQVNKARRAMAKWPKSWRKGLKLDLTILRASK